MFASLAESTAEEAGTLMRGLGVAHGSVFRMAHSPWTLFMLDERSRATAEEMASR